MDYKEIYQNCKRNFILLKNTQEGGQTPGNPRGLNSVKSRLSPHNNKLIIHISGPSGSGKTTLGNKLKEKFNDNIIVKDIDDLRGEFIKEFYGGKKYTIIDKDAYQKYIDEYVNKPNKPIIFVGLNNMPWWHKNHYYNMHSTHNYYIEIDDAIIIKQKCLRTLKNLSNNLPNDNIAMDDLINNNKLFRKLTKRAIDIDCNKKEIVKENKKWNKDYKKQEYKFMSREDIFNEVSDILNKALDRSKS